MAINIPPGDRAEANQASAASLTIAKPTNVADGDFFIAHVHYSNTSGTITPPGGWTTQFSQNASRTNYVFTKPVPTAASESATDYTFTMTGGSARIVGTILRATGVDLDTPIDVVGTGTTSGVGSTVAPSISPTSANAYMLGFFWTCDASVTTLITPPGPMTQLNQLAAEPAATSVMMNCYEQLSASGATGTRTATNTPGASSGVGGSLIALNTAFVAPTFINTVRGGPSRAAMHASIW